jgi:hypothetical protein
VEQAIQGMKLTAYLIKNDSKVDIRPAPLERDWMEGTPVRFAYRCLPLNIANAHGWEILCARGFSAIWNGGDGLDAISFAPDPGEGAIGLSHFGSGIMTFHMDCLFRTEAGFDLIVQGPVNRPKDAIYPLSGVIETDWAPFTFTMNWRFTRPGTPIRFEKGEPYCHVFPVRRADLESVTPEIREISEEPELQSELLRWRASRNSFNADLKNPDSEASAQKWQKFYYVGKDTSGRSISYESHRTKVRVRPFARIPARAK